MIANKDRSWWFGASDTDYIVGSWDAKTFQKWWLVKLGLSSMDFSNKYTRAGTHYEHAILDALNIPMQKDKQVLIPFLRLRVNLDGNDCDTIY